MKSLVTALAMVAFLVAAPGAHAQKYPQKPVRIVVPFTAGSAPDQTARIIGVELQNALGQPFVVDDKGGAQGAIGAVEVARSAPDGYTLFLGTNTTQAANVSLFKKLPYDPLKDFAPITKLAGSVLMLVVRPGSGPQTLPDFIAYARANPGKLSAGYGSAASQVAISMLQNAAGVQVLAVPYKGIPQAALDVIGGQLSFAFVDTAVGLAQIKAGKLRGLGVTSAGRSALAPDLAPLADTLPGFELSTWYGLLAPAGTPHEALAVLNDAIQQALHRPEMRERFISLGLEIQTSASPDDFGRFTREEVGKWSARIKQAGIEPE